jgi:hypothetical protein
MMTHKSLAAYDINTLFPLYLNHCAESTHPASNLKAVEPASRTHNLSPDLVASLTGRYGLQFLPDGHGDLTSTIGPEDVFHYVYAVLHSPTYRVRYAEFLKRDFPRIPFTSDRDLFRALCGLGADLVALHLLESDYAAASWTLSGEPSPLDTPITSYPEPGDDLVERGLPRYLPPGEAEPGTGQRTELGRVYVNERQYFDGVPPEVWEFHIGGYQVCEKWLKDRRGRNLSYEDKLHYQKVVIALEETIRLMAEIDDAIPSWPIT